jgi:hypothetical protein
MHASSQVEHDPADGAGSMRTRQSGEYCAQAQSDDTDVWAANVYAPGTRKTACPGNPQAHHRGSIRAFQWDLPMMQMHFSYTRLRTLFD